MRLKTGNSLFYGITAALAGATLLAGCSDSINRNDSRAQEMMELGSNITDVITVVDIKTEILIACEAYAGALDTLAYFREQRALTHPQIQTVDSVREIANPICTDPEAPTTTKLLNKLKQGVHHLILLKMEVT